MYHGHHERMDSGPPDGDFAAYVDRLTQRTVGDTAVTPQAPVPKSRPTTAPATAFGRKPAARPAGQPPDLTELLAHLRRWLRVTGYGTLGAFILVVGIGWLIAIVGFEQNSDYGWAPIVLIAIGSRLLQAAAKARRTQPT